MGRCQLSNCSIKGGNDVAQWKDKTVKEDLAHTTIW